MEIPLKVIDQGLYCPPGDFFIDAWKPVAKCLITHAHGDHAYSGHGVYIASEETIKLLHFRLGDVPSHPMRYGEKVKFNDTWVSFHPAGHILGSSQIRIETKQSVTVVSGDYKRAPDATCLPFEVVECDTFVTESTFGLPIYQWPKNEDVASQIFKWWEINAAQGHPSLIFCYSLGKAQRILSLLLEHHSNRNIYVHGAIANMSQHYMDLKIPLAPFTPVFEMPKETSFAQDLILAPPSARGSPWIKRFPKCKTALASGWMQVRGTRRRKALDRGFILSDHADWNALMQTLDETKATRILTTHGNAATLARYLREEKNLDARELKGLEISMESEDEP